MTATEQLLDLLNRAAREQWRVYGHDAGDWMPLGTAVDTLIEAQLKQQRMAARYPTVTTAIVRESSTYQIEDPK
jgi:hypothetical protein